MKQTLQTQIKELEEQGYEVNIHHLREHHPIDHSVLPNGGKTEAVLEKDGEKIFGKTFCSKEDNYNRKRGALIALGRAKRNAGLFPQPRENHNL